MSELEIILTSDGSHSLRNHRLNETYHSIHGAIRESMHVFINHGLSHYLEGHYSQPVRILEVGFGTGLNAFLTALHAESVSIPMHYTSLEPFPVGEEIYQQLNYPSLVNCKDGDALFQKLHTVGWIKEEKISPTFVLRKLPLKLEDLPLDQPVFDIVYFDAFAPSKQRELWELPALMKVEAAMKSGAVFVTYCAKGQVKRDLRSFGMTVETVSGPPGKKEMVRAVKS